MSAGWITLDKNSEGGARIFRKIPHIEDEVANCLRGLQNMNISLTDKQQKEYKNRKLIAEVRSTSYRVSRGANFTLSVSKPEADLTAEMLTSATWKEKTFK